MSLKWKLGAMALIAGLAASGGPSAAAEKALLWVQPMRDHPVHRLMQAGEYELALEAFTRAAAEQGMTADVVSAIGTANLGLGRLGQAETLLRRAVKQDEAIPETWNNLGVVLMERGKYAEAEQIFRRAYALDNGQSDSIRDNLRLALAKSENPDYDDPQQQDYKLVRRGSADYVIRQIP